MSAPNAMSAAVVMRAYGGPEVLACESVPTRPLGPREVLIATVAAAVNHTDLEIRAGRWPVRRPAPFPYVPGVEVVGAVEAVGAAVDEWTPGQAVITMMQGLGGVPRRLAPGRHALARRRGRGRRRRARRVATDRAADAHRLVERIARRRRAPHGDRADRRLAAGGAIRAPERRTFDMRDAAAAHRFLEQGGVRGRVLLVAEAGG
jgi:NADPH:quinone reductase-like Zn-dependent oxidoreductase